MPTTTRYCDCGHECPLKISKKQGRPYFNCPNYGSQKPHCNRFTWADDLQGTPQVQQLIAQYAGPPSPPPQQQPQQQQRHTYSTGRATFSFSGNSQQYPATIPAKAPLLLPAPPTSPQPPQVQVPPKKRKLDTTNLSVSVSQLREMMDHMRRQVEVMEAVIKENELEFCE